MGFYCCSIFSELWSIASWHWCIGSCHCGDMYSSEGTSGLVLCAAAWLVLGLPGCAPVSAAMHDKLHWLSFPQRVTFKLCLLTYKCLHGLAPDYLSRFCTLLTSVPGRPLLRSADANKLLVPRSCMTSFVLHSFISSGLTAWNDMPAHLRNPKWL